MSYYVVVENVNTREVTETKVASLGEALRLAAEVDNADRLAARLIVEIFDACGMPVEF